jgi:phosphoenolpyruvate synthase/pyruvate phosphate dikinase
VTELVLSLEQIGSDDRESVGGKSFALATMVKNGMKVPEALCLRVDAYATWKQQVWAREF